jgi:sterol desaturase/sphingolipid hydroxylase (fatty acid hydroxylase superfamily)
MKLQIILISIVALIGLTMLAVERIRPGREFPHVRGWLARAIWINSVQVGTIVAAGLIWNRGMGVQRGWSSDRLGTLEATLVGYFAITFVYYWWHLARHRSDFLWRWLHQMHHSAQRLEVLTAFYKRPAEIVADTVIASILLYLVLGVAPMTAAFVMVLSGLGELFYHWNVRTPYWLGFVFQRPESHLVHHEEKLHDYNYSDLPLWDIVFDTFRNPREWGGRCGLGAANEGRVLEMLFGIDVWKSAPDDPKRTAPRRRIDRFVAYLASTPLNSW